MEDTTEGTLTTAVPIMGDIHTVRTGTGITLTDMEPIPTMGRLIRPTITEASTAVTADQRFARVQERLARAGYYRGPIDGVMGPRTRYAIRVYERRHGLPADGIIDRHLLATMGIA